MPVIILENYFRVLGVSLNSGPGVLAGDVTTSKQSSRDDAQYCHYGSDVVIAMKMSRMWEESLSMQHPILDGEYETPRV